MAAGTRPRCGFRPQCGTDPRRARDGAASQAQGGSLSRPRPDYGRTAAPRRDGNGTRPGQDARTEPRLTSLARVRDINPTL